MNHFKVLIVGAGASGIAAGCKLLEHGFSDFKIFEAENHIGGRINTTYFEGNSIELGAEWIHGEDNIVYELASKCGVADNSPPFLSFNATNFYDYAGCCINKDISTALTNAFYEIMKIDERDLEKTVLNGSVGDYFDIEFKKKVSELRKKMNIDDELCKKFQKTFENWENSIDASHSWYETSLSGHLEYWECDGNNLTVWRNHRYSTLFDLLSKKIPNPEEQLNINSKIVLNKEVTKIKWNEKSNLNVPNVEVECSDGTVCFSDHVLLTCSLGVLKENACNLFLPPLPDEKIKCIQNLGFGTVDKIFIKFSNKWWGNDCNGFGFLWSEEERKRDHSGWLNGVICFHPISPDSLILRGWITAEAAQKMESLSHKEVVEGINFLFDNFLGSAFQIPKVEICTFSKWYTNPHFRGSYSCRLMKSESSNVWASQLAQPICDAKKKPVLLFGGEATHDHYFSTVHGAVEAGFREAERLLTVVKPKGVTEKKCQVAIVGAGISGLSAAKTLFESGITDILILEAQSEPGGRIRTMQFDNYNLELGAQWIHGDKNEVFAICEKNDLLSEDYSAEGEGLYLRFNGEKVEEKIVQEVDDVIKDILENCEIYVSYKSKAEIPHSIGEELRVKFDNYLDNCREDSEKIKKIKKELFDWHIRFQLIDNSCSDLYNLSAKAWGLFKFCGGNDHVNFKNGYSSLIDTIIKLLPKDIVFCKTPVERIEWKEKFIVKEDSEEENKYCAKIICNNGLTVYSDYVIVTSSLGYLKNNHKTMFSPHLPRYLSEAIEFLDFGVIDKIFLIYEKSWWDENIKGFQLVWPVENPSQKIKHWGRYVTGFDVIFKNKPVLLGWVGGEGAKMIEQMSENQVGQEATEILRIFTRNMKIPFPVKVIRTKWWCNEFVRGAYSHITVKCDENGINGFNLAKPVISVVHEESRSFKKPTILLAGESVHKNYFSTVHGAYESGKSQAQVIIQHIKKIIK